MKPGIMVIGSYNRDLTIHTPRMPNWGETLRAHKVTEGHGGKGSNQAIAAARLGGNVHFVACVGEDMVGSQAMELWKSENVNIEFVKVTPNVQTGRAFIMLGGHGENGILIDLGANLALEPADVLSAIDSGRDWALLLVQLESPHETVKTAMKAMRERGKTVIFNPAPAGPEAPELLRFASIVTPNESELNLLNGLPPDHPQDLPACVSLARNLLAQGPDAVIVTRGEKGALIVDHGGHREIPSPTVQAVDTTGAGDCFNGALAVALVEGQSLPDAVRFACFAGAYSTTKLQVIPSLPTRKELEIFMKRFES